MSITETTRPAMGQPTPNQSPPAGSDPLSGHEVNATQLDAAAEGKTSPQAIARAAPIPSPPAGSNASHAQDPSAVAVNIPGGHEITGLQWRRATGDSGQGQPAAIPGTAPKALPLLADPGLALAADVLDDLEKVRIANENRLRQLTRSEEDSDGETRGFGLDESHPDVAFLAALVAKLTEVEHKAELNLGRLVRKHPLGPWVKATNGIGEKQGARLLAAIGDPYIRPEITRENGAVEPSRPRTVSELWAYAGYHVIRTPAGAHLASDAHTGVGTGGSDFPADHRSAGTHDGGVGGDQTGHPGQERGDTQGGNAGVAPKRARGQYANWSATAKMRAHLVAVSCMKCMDSSYRKVYDDAREKYAEAIHQVPCVRCGPSGKPALHGSPLSDGHKHARALRAVAKEVLKDIWREAKRIHEDGAS